MENIKAVMFDLDNTLINRYKAVNVTFRRLLEHFSDIDVDSIEGQAVIQSMITWDQYGYHQDGYLLKELQKHYGIDITRQQYLDWWYDNLYRNEEVFDGTYQTLDYLKKKYRLAIVTNGSSHGQRRKIEHNDLERYFDAVIVSSEVGSQKPDLGIYQHAMDKLECRPQETVFVGDTYYTDILGAYKAGMIPIWLWPDPNRTANDKVRRIYDIKELMKIL